MGNLWLELWNPLPAMVILLKMQILRRPSLFLGSEPRHDNWCLSVPKGKRGFSLLKEGKHILSGHRNGKQAHDCQYQPGGLESDHLEVIRILSVIRDRNSAEASYTLSLHDCEINPP